MLGVFARLSNLLALPGECFANVVGPVGRHVAAILIYVIAPLSLTRVRSIEFTRGQAVVSGLILLAIFGEYLLKIFGHESRRHRKGLPEYVEKRGFGDALLELFDGAIATIANFAVLYACACRLSSIAQFHNLGPASPLLDALYFSSTTFFTVGYGDIYPIAPIAKELAMTEMAFGAMILLIALSLVTGHSGEGGARA